MWLARQCVRYHSPMAGLVFEVKAGQCLLVGVCNWERAVAPIDTVPSSQLLLIKVVLTTNSVCGWQGP